MTGFSATVGAWASETEKRLLSVFRTSGQVLVEKLDATAPVDTGYLRATRQVLLNQPVLPANRERGAVTALQDYSLVLASAKLGDYITVSYTANYGPHLEFGTINMAPRAWVRGAAMQWSQIVTQSVAKAKAAVQSNAAR